MDDREVTSLHGETGKVLGVRDVATGVLNGLLQDPDALLWEYFDEPVKIDHDCLIVRARLPLGRRSVAVAYKRYRPRNAWKWLCSFFRRSRARRAWRLGRALLVQGIATARPLAMVERRRGLLRRESYLATEWIEGAENLHLFGWRLAERPLDERLQCAGECAESLGQLIGRMHARQITHRDLKGANLLVGQTVEGSGNSDLTTWLVDLDGVRLTKRLSPARRAADLARLAAGLPAHPWVSRTVCWRFLRAYAAEFPSEAVDLKRLWYEVAARSRRSILRKRRGGKEVL